MIMRMAGAALIALPFIGLFVGMALDEGVLFACATVVGVGSLIAVFATGFALIQKGRNP